MSPRRSPRNRVSIMRGMSSLLKPRRRKEEVPFTKISTLQNDVVVTVHEDVIIAQNQRQAELIDDMDEPSSSSSSSSSDSDSDSDISFIEVFDRERSIEDAFVTTVNLQTFDELLDILSDTENMLHSDSDDDSSKDLSEHSDDDSILMESKRIHLEFVEEYKPGVYPSLISKSLSEDSAEANRFCLSGGSPYMQDMDDSSVVDRERHFVQAAASDIDDCCENMELRTIGGLDEDCQQLMLKEMEQEIPTNCGVINAAAAPEGQDDDSSGYRADDLEFQCQQIVCAAQVASRGTPSNPLDREDEPQFSCPASNTPQVDCPAPNPPQFECPTSNPPQFDCAAPSSIPNECVAKNNGISGIIPCVSSQSRVPEDFCQDEAEESAVPDVVINAPRDESTKDKSPKEVAIASADERAKKRSTEELQADFLDYEGEGKEVQLGCLFRNVIPSPLHLQGKIPCATRRFDA